MRLVDDNCPELSELSHKQLNGTTKSPELRSATTLTIFGAIE
jgi:hypothetical protein